MKGFYFLPASVSLGCRWFVLVVSYWPGFNSGLSVAVFTNKFVLESRWRYQTFFLLTDCGCRGDFRSASVCRGSREFFQHWAIFVEFLVLKFFFEKGRLERFANFPEIWRWKSCDFGWGLSSLVPEANRTSSADFRVELLQIQKRNYCKTSPRPSSCGRRFLALSLIFLGHKKSRSGAFWREIWDSFLLGVVWYACSRCHNFSRDPGWAWGPACRVGCKQIQAASNVTWICSSVYRFGWVPAKTLRVERCKQLACR